MCVCFLFFLFSIMLSSASQLTYSQCQHHHLQNRPTKKGDRLSDCVTFSNNFLLCRFVHCLVIAKCNDFPLSFAMLVLCHALFFPSMLRSQRPQLHCIDQGCQFRGVCQCCGSNTDTFRIDTYWPEEAIPFLRRWFILTMNVLGNVERNLATLTQFSLGDFCGTCRVSP